MRCWSTLRRRTLVTLLLNGQRGHNRQDRQPVQSNYQLKPSFEQKYLQWLICERKVRPAVLSSINYFEKDMQQENVYHVS